MRFPKLLLVSHKQRLTSLRKKVEEKLQKVKFPNDVRLEKNVTKNSDVVRNTKRCPDSPFLFLFSLYFQKRDLQSSLDEQGYLKKYFDSKKLFSENQL